MNEAGLVAEAVSRHLQESWPDRQLDYFNWSLGPIGHVLPDFRVCRVSPLRRSDAYVYLTRGAATLDHEPMHEFFLKAVEESPRHIETLAMVAHYNGRPQHRLTHGSVIDIGRPWAEGSVNTHLFVSWPYSLDPRQAKVLFGGREIVYMWLVPITSMEAGYLKTYGVSRFEEVLEDSGADLLDPQRKSIV